MNKYTIYCTEEQIEKALKLGAPIEINSHPPLNGEKFMWLSPPADAIAWNNNTDCLVPTAEQMIGWQEEQGMFIEINTHRPNRVIADWKKTIYTFSVIDKFMTIDKHGGYNGTIHYPTRKEAILAAIDTALEYLTNNKKYNE